MLTLNDRAGQDVADHANRLLADPEHDHSWIVYASAGDEVVGSLRVTWGGAGFSARQVAQYQLGPFLAELPPERMAVGERTMIAPRWRGIDLFPALGEPTSALTAAHDVRIVFGACEPHLLSFYARYQRPYGTRNINSPRAGFLIPLVSFPRGPGALAELGPDGELPECIRGVLDGTGLVLSPMLLGDAAYVQRVLGSIARLTESVFDGMAPDDVARCLERSNVITCRAGDRLLKVGGSVTYWRSRGRWAARGSISSGTAGEPEPVGSRWRSIRRPRRASWRCPSRTSSASRKQFATHENLYRGFLQTFKDPTTARGLGRRRCSRAARRGMDGHPARTRRGVLVRVQQPRGAAGLAQLVRRS